MLKWFKRRSDPPAKPAEPRPGKAAAKPAPSPSFPANRFAEPAPLPEVVAEGNTQADWGAWEDSMTAMDSQMQELVPSSRIYVRETSPSQLDELDPFAGVRRKRDV